VTGYCCSLLLTEVEAVTWLMLILLMPVHKQQEKIRAARARSECLNWAVVMA
jgi:hypothetical protein